MPIDLRSILANEDWLPHFVISQEYPLLSFNADNISLCKLITDVSFLSDIIFPMKSLSRLSYYYLGLMN